VTSIPDADFSGNRQTSIDQDKVPSYAAIDLGTNNCRMLIAEPSANGFTVVDGFSEIVRLGEGLEKTGRLQDAAMDRTIRALIICANKIRSRKTSRVTCIATEACRRASNGEEFIKRIKTEIGLNFVPVSPEEEARLTLGGCAPLLKPVPGKALLFDIGGGSTEIMWINTYRQKHPEIEAVLSLPVGVVTLSERYDDPLPTTAYQEIISAIDSQLAQFCDRHNIKNSIDNRQVQMIGTSGTVTTLGAINLNLPRYNRSRIDGLALDFSVLQTVSDRLRSMSLDERRQIPCIGRGRADLMLMGCAVLEAICKRWPVGILTAADRGIREGLLNAMIERDRLSGPIEASHG